MEEECEEDISCCTDVVSSLLMGCVEDFLWKENGRKLRRLCTTNLRISFEFPMIAINFEAILGFSGPNTK